MRRQCMGNKSISKILISGLVTIVLLLANPLTVHAESTTGAYMDKDPETGYLLVIEDDADLLTDAQEEELAAVMEDITAYGNVAFKTIESNDASTEKYARSCYKELFGTQSGTLFLIDMDNRTLWIHSDGAVYTVVTTAYANTITDNVYRDATNGKYFACAAEVYRQVFALLEGNRIAQPMKYISNGLLAMILALLLNFGLVCYFTKLKKPARNEILRNAKKHFISTKPVAEFTYKTKVYDPVSTGGSSGNDRSSSGSSRSGGGGGSRSGGGGGHRF